MMEPELEPRWSGSRAGSLMHNVIPALSHPDPVSISESLTVSSGIRGAQSGESRETGADVLALLLASVTSSKFLPSLSLSFFIYSIGMMMGPISKRAGRTV